MTPDEILALWGFDPSTQITSKVSNTNYALGWIVRHTFEYAYEEGRLDGLNQGLEFE